MPPAATRRQSTSESSCSFHSPFDLSPKLDAAHLAALWRHELVVPEHQMATVAVLVEFRRRGLDLLRSLAGGGLGEFDAELGEFFGAFLPRLLRALAGFLLPALGQAQLGNGGDVVARRLERLSFLGNAG